MFDRVLEFQRLVKHDIFTNRDLVFVLTTAGTVILLGFVRLRTACQLVHLFSINPLDLIQLTHLDNGDNKAVPTVMRIFL